ncbi:Subtilisin-like protease SBT4.14, partial [Bienertia sinuspersici]
DNEHVKRLHLDMISNASKWSDNGQMPSEKLIYSYTNIFNAFAATLHEEEADELASKGSNRN